MPESAPPENPRGRRRTRLVLATGLLAAAAVVASVVTAVTTPATLGEPTVAFDLTDEAGFDAGHDVLGGRSLAVTVLPLVPDAPAGDLLNVGGTTGLVDALNLDETVAAVRALGTAHPAAGPVAVRAESLLGQLVSELRDLPADAPVNLRSLPVGAELTEALDALREYAADGAAVTVTFTADPARTSRERDPVSTLAPEAFAAEPAEAFFGTRTVRLTEPGLYVFADDTAPDAQGVVLVDDPLTVGLDFGRRLRVTGQGPETVVPSDDDLVQRTVSSFFSHGVPDEVMADPRLPAAPVLQHDRAGDPLLVPDLGAYYARYFGAPPPDPDEGLDEDTLADQRARTLTRGDAEVETMSRAFAGRGSGPSPGSLAFGTPGTLPFGATATLPGRAPALPGEPAPARASGVDGGFPASVGGAGSDSAPVGGGGSGSAPGGDARSDAASVTAAGSDSAPVTGAGTLPAPATGGGAVPVAGVGSALPLARADGTPDAPGTAARTVDPLGASPAQSRIASPDGSALVVTDPLARTVSVVDPETARVVEDVPCAADCRGVAFGPKEGGGYLAYVLDGLAEVVQVVDLDPNGDGTPGDSGIIGRLTQAVASLLGGPGR